MGVGTLLKERHSSTRLQPQVVICWVMKLMKPCAACKQEYEERSARIRRLRVQVGGETDNLNTLTAALEAKKVPCTPSLSNCTTRTCYGTLLTHCP